MSDTMASGVRQPGSSRGNASARVVRSWPSAIRPVPAEFMIGHASLTMVAVSIKWCAAQGVDRALICWIVTAQSCLRIPIVRKSRGAVSPFNRPFHQGPHGIEVGESEQMGLKFALRFREIQPICVGG